MYAVEFGAVAEHGDDVRWVFFLVPDELEGDTPEHSHADEAEARGCVDGIHIDVVGLLSVIVNRIIYITAGAVGGVSVIVGASWLSRNGRTLEQTGVRRRGQHSSSLY